MHPRTHYPYYARPTQLQPSHPPFTFCLSDRESRKVTYHTFDSKEDLDEVLAYGDKIRKRSRPLTLHDLSPIKRMIRDEIRVQKRVKIADSYVHIERCNENVEK